MKRTSGFTLVEAVATGAISVILAGTILSTLKMNSNQLREGTARLRIGQIASTVSDQIRRQARAAALVKTAGDHPYNAPAALAVNTSAFEITFCKTTA